MKKNKVQMLEARIVLLEQQLEELIGFLQHAIRLRREMDAGIEDESIDRLMP